MDSQKNRRVVCITGGTSGIGLATAKCFLDHGDTVIVAGRSKARAKAALCSIHGDCHYVELDVRSRVSCQSVMDGIADRFGKLDVLVNAAGIYHEGALETVDETVYESIMSTNLHGTVWMSQAALPLLKKTRGNIVNVSSDAGLHGNYFCAVYAASKGAVNLFTRSLALETASFQVRVNAICPGDILTPMTEAQLACGVDRDAALCEMASVYPLGRIGRSEEVADVIVFLASEKASFITGVCWSVDGGLTA